MTFNAKSLARQSIGAASADGNAGHSSHYWYRTADTIATVLGATYWNNARNRLKVGDVVDIISSAGGTPTCTRIIFLTVPASGNLTFAEIGGVAGVGQGYKIARIAHTQVAAVDTVVTGLATVVAVVASLETDPADGCFLVSAQVGDQAGSPAAGSVYVKAWKSADGADVTPVAATSFGQKVNLVAIGT